MKLIILLRFQLLFFSLCSFLTLFGQIPTGYYSSAEGLTKNELKEELNNIIDGHIEFPYTSSAVDVWDILKDTDRDTIDTSKVVLLYTGWLLMQSKNIISEVDGQENMFGLNQEGISVLRKVLVQMFML